MKQLVMGILAHVDSGKTTLSEALLYSSGNIKTLGRVDHKSTLLDSYMLERERGITIFSKQAILTLPNEQYTLLDTPGHVDFSPEMERTLQVLDYAILVISGTSGMQSHTETLWRLLKKHKIPTFIFVNKMDLSLQGKDVVLNQLKKHLSQSCVDFSQGQPTDTFMENIATCDENLLATFLETDNITDTDITTSIKNRLVFPCFFGSALKLDGIEEFLNALQQYTITETYKEDFGAKIFKISRDTQGNRLTYLKITGGSLKVREVITGTQADGVAWFEKINQIRVYSGEKHQTVDIASQGMVVAVVGPVKTQIGQGLGTEKEAKEPVLEPILTYRVILPETEAANTVYTKFQILEEEEPQLHLVWDETLQEIHLQLMGEIQLEIIKHLMQERFGLDLRFDQGSILYKETISNTVIGRGHFEPLRHYAEVHLLLEPAEQGTGTHFSSTCPDDTLAKAWQRLVLTYLYCKNHVGVLTGSPITDCKITLITGKADKKHTDGGDFAQATYRAVRQGLKKANTVLLEPWYDIRLELPLANVGRAMADLERMHGVFSLPETTGDEAVLTGIAPVVLFRDYQIELNNYTHGKGKLFCSLHGYMPCHNTSQVVADINYNSETDINNPSTSIFCSHGAGYSVQWDESDSKMHLESFLPGEPKQEEILVPITRQAMQTYGNSLVHDKELLSIFENTYGTVKRDLYTSLDTNKTKTPLSSMYNLKEKTEEYLLVDGYNIIFAWENLKTLAQDDLNLAREKLIQILSNYQGFKQCNVILVFDAYKVKGNVGDIEKVNNITVVYTKEAETADMYIEKVTREIGRKYIVRVATSDSVEQLIIFGYGAYRVSANAFYQEVKQVEDAIKEFLLEDDE